MLRTGGSYLLLVLALLACCPLGSGDTYQASTAHMLEIWLGPV